MMQTRDPSVESSNWPQVAHSLDEMQAIADRLAELVKPNRVLYFEGELGAGKTTLIQGICQTLGVSDSVLSPTFSILKPYIAGSGLELLHVDLYRIDNPAELLFIGIEDFIDSNCTWLIEWPERGADVIPPPDVCIRLEYQGNARSVSIRSR